MNVVIMAGGSGTRLWPKSRKKNPKQFTKIFGNKTMIENTYERLEGFFPLEKIYFSTIPDFAEKIKKLFPNTPENNIIVEPEKRDNAAAHGYVAVFLSKKFGDEPLAFIPSDHFIDDVVRFHKTLNVAKKYILEQGKMVDIAIKPSFPSTVLGYTEISKKVGVIDGVEIYQFESHTEKPDFKTAKRYLKKGNYLWHGNYYMWTPNKFLEAYKKYAPKIHEHLTEIGRALDLDDFEKVRKEYLKIEKTSIDYAITEKMKSNDVYILKGDFGWSDIGAWDVLHDLLKIEKDPSQNLVQGKWIGNDTSGSFISAPSGKLIATVGVDDLIIVDTKDALLVCPRSRAQDVKKIVSELETSGDLSYL